MDTQRERREVVLHLLQSIVDVIGRRSSDVYATVMVNNVLKKLKESHQCLRYVKIQNPQHLETSDVIVVFSTMNTVSISEIRDALQDLLVELLFVIGKTAGHFFIKEIKENLDRGDEATLQMMGLDLDFMQLQQSVEKRQPTLQPMDTITLLKRLFEALLGTLAEKTGKDTALSLLMKCFEKLSEEHPIFKHITIHDIRYIQSEETFVIPPGMNQVDHAIIRTSIEQFLRLLQKTLEEKEIFLFKEQVENHLKPYEIAAIEKLGISLKIFTISHEMILRQVIRTLLEVLGRASTKSYAMFAVNSFLRKIDTTYSFLKDVKIISTSQQNEAYDISIMTNLDDVSDGDTRKAIQRLLQELIDALGEDLGQQFIDQFKNALSKVYLDRIEEMGVNLHMLQLRQEFMPKHPIQMQSKTF